MISKSFYILFVFFWSIHSEVTHQEDDEVIPRNACNISVRNSNYRLRERPRAEGRRNMCRRGRHTLRTNGYNNNDSILALGISDDGRWIKVGSPSCSGNEGWVHRGAFNSSELQALATGQCAAMRNYGYRNAPEAPAPDTGTDVSPRGNNSHRFPLDVCRGVRSDRWGAGHYGASRGGGTRTHNGCDYRAPVGAALKSPCAGRITRSGNSGAAGELIEVTCDNGDRFVMMHLRRGSRIRHGTRVGIGTRVGLVGTTGNAEGLSGMQPHLHLEAYIGGRRVDPQPLWNCNSSSAR